MSKPKSNSILDKLAPNQLAQLEDWLFVEKISYKDAAARLLADCDCSCAPSSLSAWYQRTAQRRMLDRIAASRSTQNEVLEKFKANPADTYAALLDMAGQIAFDKAFQSEKELDAETIFNFTKLVMSGRKQAMDQQALDLARDKFQFDAAKACLAKIDSIKSIRANATLDQNAKIEQIRLQLFGVAPK